MTATEVATGVPHNTVTTSNGEFSFQDLPLGAYNVGITASDFKPLTFENVNVTAGNVYTVTAQLSIGQSSMAVEVSAAAIQVDTTTATQSDTLTNTTLQSVPLNGRDFTQLVAVAPAMRVGVFEPGQGLVIQGQGINSIFQPDRNKLWPRFGCIRRKAA